MGDLFYRNQEGPKDSEVKQPGENVDYSADSPTTWSKKPRGDRGIPPGNPGFTNLPERDSMNPSSGKVIPEQMKETLRQQVTYVSTASAARVAAQFAARSAPRPKTAARIDELMTKTGPLVHQRSQGLEVLGKRFNPKTGFWGFTVVGSSGKPYYVRVKGVRKSKKVVNLSKADVKVSCSCEFWRWQGPEHWGKTNSFLYGRPRGTASLPVIRDPKEKHWACKHLLAALRLAKGYRFSSSAEAWSVDGPLAPLIEADAHRVAARYIEARETFPALQKAVDKLHADGVINYPIEVRYFGPIGSGNVEIQLLANGDPSKAVGRFFTSKVADGWESPKSLKLTPDCLKAYRKVRRKFREAGLWSIEWAFLNDDRLWGHGLGKMAYEQILKDAGSFGAVVLPQGCRPGGNTTPAAQRVWNSVQKRHQAEGPIVIPNNFRG